MGYEINPVLVARAAMDESLMTYFANFGKGVMVPAAGWYIQVGDKDILIDTGAGKETIDIYWPYGSQHVQTFEESLGKLGKKPEDIDYIIATHLHFDHIANARFCKNARVICQEAELKFARSPHALVAGLYPQEMYTGLQFETVVGESEIFPGIRVIPAPGHSPGCQAVSVETDKGLAVLSGFCCTSANFDVPDQIKAFWPVYAPGIHTDAVVAFDSAVKMKELADILIPLHEEKFATMEKIPA
jgi:N-acyl homoserine lactone hydrolase